MENLSIFDFIYEDRKPFKFDPNKKLRLITLFSGYDSQALALKYLGVPFEHYRTCEWTWQSTQALKDVHFPDDSTDYSSSVDDLPAELFKLGISNDYSKPMELASIKRKNLEWQKRVYNNIISTHNMVNIMNVKGKDLGIVDPQQYQYLMFYSFPCQDLSLAGKRAGMGKGTRSGLLSEVERLLYECKELGNLPNCLVMENVPQVIGANGWKEWCLTLENLGYSNYCDVLNAEDFEVPQSRKRAFMVSVLGNYTYRFSRPKQLTILLQDVLEPQVDEKYYLTKEKLDKISSWGGYEDPLLDINPDRICSTITTHCGKDSNGMQLVEEMVYEGTYEYAQSNTFRPTEESRVHHGNQISGSILASGNQNGVIVNKRIRKLTPRECLRLMGVRDKDIDNMKKHLNDGQLWHMAGDSIVVDVLSKGIFCKFFDEGYNL